MSKKKLKAIMALMPRSRGEMEQMVASFVADQTERERLIAERDQEYAAAQAKLEERHGWSHSISQLDLAQAQRVELLEAWADQNRAEFPGELKSLDAGQARIGFRDGKWKTELAAKTVWADVVCSLQQWFGLKPKTKAEEVKLTAATLWLRFFEPEADKARMITDRDNDELKPLLGELGVSIVRDEDFYIDPHREGQEPAAVTA